MVKREILVNFFKQFNNPFVICVLLCVFFFYGLKIPVRNVNKFHTLCTLEEIISITGEISSNPVKNFENHSYSFFIDCVECMSYNGAIFSAYGKIKVFISEEIAESFFPEKLYSSSNKNTVLFEKNEKIIAKGKITGNIFSVTECKNVKQKGIFYSVNRIRSLSRLHFRRLMYYWKDAGFLFLALLSGIKDYVAPEINEAFKKAGLSHILALSGMHLSIFTGLSLKIFSIFFSNKKRNETISLGFQFIIILVFLWFAGVSPSLFRAFLCSLFVILCKLLKIRNVNQLYVLSLSFLLHIIIFPSDLYSLAFIFSYGALSGILIFSKPVSSFFSHVLPFKLSENLSSSFSAQIISCPIQLYNFKSFSPSGIIATLIISPLITIFIYLGLFLFLLNFIFPFISEYGVFLMNFLYNIIEKTVSFFAEFPIIQIR